MAEPHGKPGKRDVTRALLTRGNCLVHLDPRSPVVVVPDWLRRQPQLVLQIGLDMPVPIPDLRVDDDGVSGTLSFNRSPFTCHVPWSAVFAVVAEDGSGMVWPEDIPLEIADEVEREVRRRHPVRLGNELLEPNDSSAKGPPADHARRRASLGSRRVRGQASRARAHKPPDPEPQTPEPTPTPTSGKSRRSKRPLPPYLRVVK